MLVLIDCHIQFSIDSILGPFEALSSKKGESVENSNGGKTFFC
jgi:hypothetical protein